MNNKFINRIAAVFFTFFILFTTSCEKKQLETVNLSMWAAADDMEMLSGMIDKFKEAHKDEILLNVTLSEEEADTVRETILSSPEHAADIFFFVDDQFSDFYNAGIFLPITENKDAIINANGGDTNSGIKAATINGELYAYPLSAGNTYFLYYDSSYFTDDDVKSIDKILNVAKKNNKKFSMDFSSGWYIYSFFKAAGLDISYDEKNGTGICEWNSTDGKYKGKDVAKAMLNIAENDAFYSCSDEAFKEGIKSGEIIAGINGAWNAAIVEEALGEKYAACKLPKYTLNGDELQMCSFAGYKYIGVNKLSENPFWAAKLAEWLTNSENQLERFRKIGEVPSITDVAFTDEVQSAPAVAAITEQLKYGFQQNVPDGFWEAADILGTTISSGTVDDDELQGILDRMAEETFSKRQ